MVLELVQHHSMETVRVVVVADVREDLEIPAGDVLEQQRGCWTLARGDWQFQQLAMAQRHVHADALGLGVRHAMVDPRREAALRPVVRRLLSPRSEHLAEAAARGDDDQIVISADSLDRLDVDRSDDEFAARCW